MGTRGRTKVRKGNAIKRRRSKQKIRTNSKQLRGERERFDLNIEAVLEIGGRKALAIRECGGNAIKSQLHGGTGG